MQIESHLRIAISVCIHSNIILQNHHIANDIGIYVVICRSNILGNYRPISLTSIPCKVMEHIIFYHMYIMNHFDTLNILNPLQHGFRPNHSCQSQLISFVEDIQFSMNNHKQVDLLFLDFSKAFDTVPHMQLLNKLSFYGIQGPILQWICSWLTQQKQQVVVDGESSSATIIKSGPLMFLVYINDINESFSSSIRLFADDCVVYSTISTPRHAEQLQDDLNHIYACMVRKMAIEVKYK